MARVNGHHLLVDFVFQNFLVIDINTRIDLMMIGGLDPPTL
jgi:hypothetical protein